MTLRSWTRAREKEIARVKVGKRHKRVLVIDVPQDQLTEK